MELLQNAFENPYGLLVSLIGFLGSLFLFRRARKQELQERYERELEQGAETAADLSVRVSDAAYENDNYLESQREIDEAILNSITIPKE
jgi:hypothetical protein